MTNSAILDPNGDEIQEGIMDAVITGFITKHTLLGNGPFQNTEKGSIYIVKPKMHGSKEIAFANQLFDRVEDSHFLILKVAFCPCDKALHN